MSTTSKVVLGVSVILTLSTVAGVHIKQRLDQEVNNPLTKLSISKSLYNAPSIVLTSCPLSSTPSSWLVSDERVFVMLTL